MFVINHKAVVSKTKLSYEYFYIEFGNIAGAVVAAAAAFIRTMVL